MRRIIGIFVLSIIMLSASAQNESTENTIKNEVGFALSGFNSFGFTAKLESQPKRLWRFGAATFIGEIDRTSRDSISLDRLGVDMEFSFGREIRKPITDEFHIFFGVDAIVGFNINNNKIEVEVLNTIASEEINDRSVRAGIGIPVGFNYILKDMVVFSMEFVPTVGLQYQNIASTNSNTRLVANIVTTSLFTNINTQALTLSVAYRFEKRRNR